MEQKFREIIDNVKQKSRTLRLQGRRCCANNVLHVATYLENELKEVAIAPIVKREST